MSIVVTWDDEEKTIIRWNFGEIWSWDDFHQAFEISLQMVKDIDQRIDVIPYLAASKHVPPSALTEFNRIQQKMPANTHLIVITGGRAFDNAIIAMFKAAYQVKSWRIARTLDEARAVIQREREKDRQAS